MVTSPTTRVPEAPRGGVAPVPPGPQRPHRPTRRTMMLAAAIGTFLLGGCGGAEPAASSLADGHYTGQSATESDGSYATVAFTVSGGTVTDASFVVRDADGTPHDENYGLGSDGKPADQQFYQRAQNAIAAEHEFITQFEQTGDQNRVEAIAGASLSHRLFLDAVAEAIGGSQS